MDKYLSPRRRGLLLAALTAVISGFAVFFNSYGVRAWADVADATTYTTAKNLVAAVVIAVVALSLGRGESRRRADRTWSRKQVAMLVSVAVIGGAVPFVLFFEGLAQTSATQAALIHKTLLIWVAVIASVFLRERIGWVHLVAIGLLVGGQVVLAGDVGAVSFGAGEQMILAATLLWSIEVVVAKRALVELSSRMVASARMIGGSLLLVVYLLVRGVDIELSALTGSHLVWVVIAGGFLSAYVLTWLAALSLAPAIDVTAVLVAGAVITALLQTAVRGAALASPVGLMLVVAGSLVVTAISWSPQRIQPKR